MTIPPTTTELQAWRAKAEACVRRIADEDYYPAHWAAAQHTRPLAEIQTMDELLAPFQKFWELLPDSRDIRRGPFFDVCELAEEWCFGDWRQPMEASE